MEDRDLETVGYIESLSEELELSRNYNLFNGIKVSAILADGVRLIHRLEADRHRFDNYFRAVSMAFRASQMRELRGSFSHDDFDEMIRKILGDTYPDAATTFNGD